jgi:hypothetical protein
MEDYQTFREELRITCPNHGYALWNPDPWRPDIPVQVGDVGYLREGKFYRLFNAFLDADDASQCFGVPANYTPLTLRPRPILSGGVERQMYFYSRHVVKASRERHDEYYSLR